MLVDVPVDRFVNRLGFGRCRHDAENPGCGDQRGDGQRHRMGRDFVNRRKAPVVHLLIAADLIEFYRFYSRLVVKIGNAGIVEGNVSVLADPHDDNIRRIRLQKVAVPLRLFFGVGRRDVDKMHALKGTSPKICAFRKLPNPCGASLSSPIYSSMW